MNTESKVSAFDRRKQWRAAKDEAGMQLAGGSRESKAKNIFLIPLSGQAVRKSRPDRTRSGSQGLLAHNRFHYFCKRSQTF